MSQIGFGYSKNLSMFCILWSLHGLFQGISGPNLTKYVCDNYNNNTILSIDTVWSILICAGNIGYLICPFILLPIIEYYNWKYCYKILGLIGISISILIYLLIHKNNNNNIDNNIMKEKNKENNINKNGLIKVFMKVQFWFTLLSSIITYLALKTMADWTYLFLVEYHKMNMLLATELMLYNEIFIFGFIHILGY
jgi:sugar phosphate permease